MDANLPIPPFPEIDDPQLRSAAAFTLLSENPPPVVNPHAYREDFWEERTLARFRTRSLPTQQFAFLCNLRSCPCCRFCKTEVESHSHIFEGSCSGLNYVTLSELYTRFDLSLGDNTLAQLLTAVNSCYHTAPSDGQRWTDAAEFILKFIRDNKLFRFASPCNVCPNEES